MDKNRIKTELLIHDLKNPLAVIEAGIHALIHREEKYGPLTEKHLKALKRTLRNAKIAKALVNDILEVGRSTEGVINRNRYLFQEFIKSPLVEVFDLTDQETAEEIKECPDLSQLKAVLSGKHIVLNMDEGLWSEEVCLDINKMKQILRNLMSNALKYREKAIELNIEKKNGTLFISVCDDGEGIEKNYHEKIFECYFQLEEEREHCIRGHGLGLAGVLILVEDMGGKMTLESDKGKGAKFTVRIPLGGL